MAYKSGRLSIGDSWVEVRRHPRSELQQQLGRELDGVYGIESLLAELSFAAPQAPK